jgi:hypothetical protein
VAVELDVDRNVVSWKFPRVKVEPIIRDFDLVSIDNFLLEDTISVSQSVAPGWIVERCHAVQEAGGQTSEAAISQRSVVLLGDDIFDAKTEVFEAVYRDNRQLVDASIRL